MIIYHITTRANWEEALLTGRYTAASLDSEGFIHASTAEQVAGTANLFFNGQVGLVILAIDSGRLTSEVRFDTVQSHGATQHFPHIYGPINVSAVIEVYNFAADQEGRFHFKGR